MSGALAQIRDVVTTVVVTTETVQTIEERPLPCEWTLPEPPRGQVFDRQQVNVELSGSDVDTRTLGWVPSPDACAAFGWHYDDPHAPTRVVACPQTCSTIQSTAGARVDVVLGCTTVLLE